MRQSAEVNSTCRAVTYFEIHNFYFASLISELERVCPTPVWFQ